MARLSEAEIVNVISQAVATAGGEIAHNDLVGAMVAADAGQYAPALVRLAQSGAIVATVRAVPDGSPVLVYSMPA